MKLSKDELEDFIVALRDKDSFSFDEEEFYVWDILIDEVARGLNYNAGRAELGEMVQNYVRKAISDEVAVKVIWGLVNPEV
jgi:hypothetical protein